MTPCHGLALTWSVGAMDARSLAAARILTALTLLYETTVGLDWHTACSMLTDDGVWPRMEQLECTHRSPQFLSANCQRKIASVAQSPIVYVALVCAQMAIRCSRVFFSRMEARFRSLSSSRALVPPPSHYSSACDLASRA